MVSEAIIQFVIISLVSTLYAILTIVATNILGNRNRVNDIQKEIKQLNDRVQVLQKSKDKKSEDELAKVQEKIPNLLFESMVLQFKPLIITVPALFIIPPFLKSMFTDFTIKLSFSLPIFIQHFERFPNWRDVFGTTGWFWLAFILSSLIIQGVITIIKKMKKGENNAVSKAQV